MVGMPHLVPYNDSTLKVVCGSVSDFSPCPPDWAEVSGKVLTPALFSSSPFRGNTQGDELQQSQAALGRPKNQTLQM